MTTTNTGKLKLFPTRTPALPFAPVQYDQHYQDQLLRILTQYLTQNDNVNNELLSVAGGKYLSLPYGSFISTTSQTAAVINTAYPITLSGLDGSGVNNEIYIGSGTANTFPDSKIYAPNLGVYNMQFSLQLQNTDTQAHDVNIWLRYNGTNVADSNTLLTVPSSHGGVSGHLVAAWNFFLLYDASGDYFELCWSTNNTAVSIPAYTASAPAPATPSVIMTVNFVSRV